MWTRKRSGTNSSLKGRHYWIKRTPDAMRKGRTVGLGEQDQALNWLETRFVKVLQRVGLEA